MLCTGEEEKKGTCFHRRGGGGETGRVIKLNKWEESEGVKKETR